MIHLTSRDKAKGDITATERQHAVPQQDEEHVAPEELKALSVKLITENMEALRELAK